MIAELHAWNGQRPNVTVNIGRIRSGGAVNVVPDLAVFRVNLRVAGAEDQAWVEKQMEQIVNRFHQPDEGFRVKVEGGISSPPKPCCPQLLPWISQVERAAVSLGQKVHWRDSGGASDGNRLQTLGLLNLDTMGPDGDALHSHEEWIDLGSLPAKTSLMVRLLEELQRSSSKGSLGYQGNRD
jgi:glutamate carboxypeptidase